MDYKYISYKYLGMGQMNLKEYKKAKNSFAKMLIYCLAQNNHK